jgi:hypothetical protein
LVVLDGSAGQLVLEKARVPKVPIGVLDNGLVGPDLRSISVPAFNWLRSAERARGEAFQVRAQMKIQTGPDQQRQVIVLEEPLLGSQEPVRFLYSRKPLEVDLLRGVIARLQAPTLRWARNDLENLQAA